MNQPNRFLTAVRNRRWVSLTILVLVLLASLTGAFLQAKRIALQRVELLIEDKYDDSQHHLVQMIATPLLVPDVLARSAAVRALLSRPDAIAAKEQNEILEDVARAIHVDVIYLLDQSGKCLATSNWRAPDSFLGLNYEFRPYFQQAIAGSTGRYTAKGVTSLKVGHYLARPVTVNGKVRGVIVVKISFGSMLTRANEHWQRDQEMVLVTDENGVIIVSALDKFNFKTIETIPEPKRKALEQSHQYGNDISPVSLTKDEVQSDRLHFVEFKDLPNRTFLQRSYVLPDLGLRLYMHLPASRYWETVVQFTAMFSMLALLIFLTCISLFQRWAYTAKLIETAIRDPLTGLNTRLYMNDWCHAAISAHNRDPGAGIGLAVFDLDLFKQVNDMHGHLVGDEVLRRVGEIIRAEIRGADLAVRFGGEELAVFMHCADLGEAAAMAERIRVRVEHTEFQNKGARVPVTLSGGVAYHAPGETLDALFARADKKLYEAKELGRNRIKKD